MEGRTGLEMHWGWKVQTCEAKSKKVQHSLQELSTRFQNISPFTQLQIQLLDQQCWSYRQGEKIWMQCGHKTGGAVIRNRPVVVTKPIPNKGGSTPPKHPPSSSATYLSGWESKRRRWVSSCQTPSQCFRVFQLFKKHFFKFGLLLFPLWWLQIFAFNKIFRFTYKRPSPSHTQYKHVDVESWLSYQIYRRRDEAKCAVSRCQIKAFTKHSQTVKHCWFSMLFTCKT